jgi:succinate dehydrogenase/fumarate reductase flavoprotein subunit
MTATGRAGTLECDRLVIGGGAAGLAGAVTAACHGLTVVVAEKAPVLGAATSWSGGWMWAPLDPLSQAGRGRRGARDRGRRSGASRPHGGDLTDSR